MSHKDFMQEMIKQALNHPGEFNEITLYPTMRKIQKEYANVINVVKNLLQY